MKKGKLVLFSVFFILSFSSLYANTSITGSYGYFTIPITSTPDKGALHINSGYIFTPGNFYVSANIAFLENWEISAGKEFLTSSGSEIGQTPFILGTKYMFYEKRDFRAAAGLQMEIAGETAGFDGIPVTIYGVIGNSAGQFGYLNFGLGYTLGIDAEYSINCFLGLRKALIGDKLFFIGEFTNYSVRQGFGLPWDLSKGVFNAGLVLELTEFLKFKFMTFDMLDKFLTVGLGGELRLKIF